MSSSDQTAAENLKHVLDAARIAIDHEFRRAERLDANARGQATLAGSWMVVAQAAAAVAINADPDSAWLIAVPLLAVAVSFFLLLRESQKVWKIRWSEDVGEATLGELAADVRSPDFPESMIVMYRDILNQAQDANDRRAEALGPTPNRWSATTYWYWVLALGFLEVVVALGSLT